MVPFIPSILAVFLGAGIASLLNPVFGHLVFVVLIAAGMVFWLTMAVVLASRLYLAFGERLNEAS
jgi:hypothetical protein